jgi:hypothetical protein
MVPPPPSGWAVPASIGGTAPAFAGRNEIARALVTGIAAAILAGAVWYLLVVLTDMRIGIAAIGVGFLVGLGASFEQQGRDRLPLQLIAVTLTLLTLFFAEYFIVRHAALELLANNNFNLDVPLLMSPGDMTQIVRDEIGEDPILLLFWAIAVFQAWVVPVRGMPFVGPRTR